MSRHLKPMAGRRFTNDCLIRGREAEGRKSIVKRGANQTRVVQKGPGDRPMNGAQSELVASSDIIDIQPTSVLEVEAAPLFQVVGERGGITIPTQSREKHGLRPGTAVLLEDREDGLLLRPAQVIPRNLEPKPDQRTHPTLAELVAGITPGYCHEEIDFGPPVGGELL